VLASAVSSVGWHRFVGWHHFAQTGQTEGPFDSLEDAEAGIRAILNDNPYNYDPSDDVSFSETDVFPSP